MTPELANIFASFADFEQWIVRIRLILSSQPTDHSSAIRIISKQMGCCRQHGGYSVKSMKIKIPLKQYIVLLRSYLASTKACDCMVSDIVSKWNCAAARQSTNYPLLY